MSDLDTQFQQAADNAQKLPTRPSNDDLLQLYALYKQGTAGDASGKRPGLTKMVARAKFDAWAAKKGLSQNDAKQAYVDLVKKLEG